MSDIRSQLATLSSRKPTRVEVSGCVFYAKRLKVKDIALGDEEDKNRASARRFANMICTEDGRPVYDAANEHHIDDILELDIDIVTAITSAMESSAGKN